MMMMHAGQQKIDSCNVMVRAGGRPLDLMVILRVRVYPRVGSGSNFRHGSGTGRLSIIGYRYGSDS